MMEINLLPETFQSTQEAKRLPTLHCFVIAAVLAVIAIAETTRGLNTRDLNSELDTVSVSFSQAQQEVKALSTLTAELHALEEEASLGVSLLHPLSRSRIIAELGRRCPTDIHIAQLQVGPHLPAAAPAAPAVATPRRGPKRAPKNDPPSTDELQAQQRRTLAAEADQGVQAVIEGRARQIANVHAFVQRIEEFADVELDTVTNHGESFQFRIVAVIRSDAPAALPEGAAK